MKKVFLWLVVISVITVFSIVGCKGEAEEPAAEEEVEEEAAEEEVTEEAEEEVVDPASFEGEITVWHFNDEFAP